MYYATSDSPYGPFTHEGPLVAINPDIREIDGHPFRDEDGKLYMSFSRYDRGGTVWLQEVTMQDGDPNILTVRGPSNTPMPLPANRYHYDVDRDGRVTVLDALLTIKAVLAGSYTGRYDTNANGSLGRNDIVAVLKAAAAS